MQNSLVRPAAPLDDLEPDSLRRHLEDLLRAHAGNVNAVARELGKPHNTIHRWTRRFGIDPMRYRSGSG